MFSDQTVTRSYQLKDGDDLDPLVERIGDAQYVLLGEASHGTHEYYMWRSRLSRRLIEEKSFQFIAVEGDWPDCYRVNQFVRGDDSSQTAEDVLHAFARWPTWMWANWEIVALVEWLRLHNQTLPAEKQTGFYGLDVYALWESLHRSLIIFATTIQTRCLPRRMPFVASSRTEAIPRVMRLPPDLFQQIAKMK